MAETGIRITKYDYKYTNDYNKTENNSQKSRNIVVLPILSPSNNRQCVAYTQTEEHEQIRRDLKLLRKDPLVFISGFANLDKHNYRIADLLKGSYENINTSPNSEYDDSDFDLRSILYSKEVNKVIMNTDNYYKQYLDISRQKLRKRSKFLPEINSLNTLNNNNNESKIEKEKSTYFENYINRKSSHLHLRKMNFNSKSPIDNSEISYSPPTSLSPKKLINNVIDRIRLFKQTPSKFPRKKDRLKYY